jgi:galactose mutarotase-like enzyme
VSRGDQPLVGELELNNNDLDVQVAPDSGAAVRSVRLRATGTEVLFQAPWSVAPPPAPPADSSSWTAAWPGGWHPLFPNAGEPTTVDGGRRGFHGEASISAWRVVESLPDRVEMRWRDRTGLESTRCVRLDGCSVVVSNEVINRGEQAAGFVFVEHLILGPPLIGDGTRIAAPAAPLLPLADTGEPLIPAHEARPWPTACRNGAIEDWSASEDGEFSRFGVLIGVPSPSVTVSGEAASVTVTWTADTLPHLWAWHEYQHSEEMPEGRRIRCLGLEPASVPHSLGLQAAKESGDMTVLAPGERWRSEVRLSVLAA